MVFFLLVHAATCSAADALIPTGDGAIPALPATIAKPEGAGPFPAIVLLHDCSGLGPRSSGAPARWAKAFVARGYAVILPDSFSPRGHADGICLVPPWQRHAGVSVTQRARDAYSTLAYLRTLPYIDASRIGVMGGSHGGASTLATLADAAGQDPFTAGVALYPACAVKYGSWTENMTGVYSTAVPLYILIGEVDDWTPAENCRKLAEAAQKAGHPVRIKVYAGAHHSFDSATPVRYVASRVNSNAPGRRGATTGGQPEAWADSIREVTGFFDRHLGRTP
jgi:dienelactone hydrolase